LIFDAAVRSGHSRFPGTDKLVLRIFLGRYPDHGRRYDVVVVGAGRPGRLEHAHRELPRLPGRISGAELTTVLPRAVLFHRRAAR
jgi:hypothetical protein